MVPPAHRKTDMGSGHACHFPPSPATGGSPNVFINGLPAMRVGDEYEPHGCAVCPEGSHARKLAQGSRTVFINGIPAGRVGDAIDCGGVAQTGSPNVFIGDHEAEVEPSNCQKIAADEASTATKG